MLSRRDNDTLTRVGPGTPTGELMRRYWIPAVYPADIPTPDCPPVRLRLLGEDLVAFRDSSGKPGLVAAACPHRGASLFFGRNEQAGIRCVYHGWKFDVSGACVDMPNEPAESNFKHKIRVTAYPCVEKGGVIWAYMGPAGQLPPLPAFMSNLLPESHVHVELRVQESNYLQGLEGGYDSSHVGFLHSRLDGAVAPAPASGRATGPNRLMEDRRPRFSVVDTGFGVIIASQRKAGEGTSYWRANLFLLPFYHMSPGAGHEGLGRWSGWVPIDDENTMRWVIAWHSERPITEADLAPNRVMDSAWYLMRPDEYEPPSLRPGSPWRTGANKRNDYQIDRVRQRTLTFTGVLSLQGQDQVVTESPGPIVDRTREHLGTADLGIIAARRRLLREVEALRNHDKVPEGVTRVGVYCVRSSSRVIDDGVSWELELQDEIMETSTLVTGNVL